MNNNETIDAIYGVFTPEGIESLHTDYKTTLNPNVSLRKIATPLFRKHHIRTWDEASPELKEDIQTAFFNIQSLVITTTRVKTKTIEHIKGDPIRDSDGTPICDGTNADGTPRVKTYPKNTLEKVEVKTEVPYFNWIESSQSLRELEKRLRNIEVLPDYEELRKKFNTNTNFDEACDWIRKLTQYYVFESPDDFVERFALLVCNAKAKALGYQPKWPVMFSLVGKMGVGKSWLAQMLKKTHDKLFDCRSGTTSYGRLLGSNFNSMMTTRGFLTLDEAQGLDKAQWDRFKTLITSTSIEIERKGVDVQTCDNLTTFFSTTNESVRDLLINYQEDRRIIEFNIVRKDGEIPENDIRDWFERIWTLMPIEHPHAQDIKESLLAASNEMLDTNMSDIIYELFKNGCDEFMDGKGRLKVFQFKKAVKELGGISYARVRDWCSDHMILNKQNDGRVGLSRRAVNDFMKEYGKEDI